jgi:sensor histidine kinase YesM
MERKASALWLDKPINYFLANNNLWRWGSIVFSGLFVNLFIDLIFGLLYRNYILFTNGWSYAGAILLSLIILSGIRSINKSLDIEHPWEENSLKRFRLQTLYNIGYVLLIMIGVRYLTNLFLGLIDGPSFTKLINEILITATVVIITFIIVLIDWGLYLLNNWRNSLAEIERFKKERLEFQYETLRNQVNPHFLFNSLNTISSLIYENPESANKFVKQLAKVYRYVLEYQNKDLVPLADEKTFVESFIYLLELRFANNLIFKIDISGKAIKHYIIPMGLQMLIENALKHNVVGKNKPLTIEIYDEEGPYIVVKHNLQRKQNPEYSSQIGLKNIKNRYQFQTQMPVLVIETDTTFTVKLPLLNNPYENFIS